MFRIKKSALIALGLIGNLYLAGCISCRAMAENTRVPASQETVTPRLFFQTSPIFDMLCQQTSFKIDPAIQGKYQKELNEKLGVFQSEWDKASVCIIPESEKAAGIKFSRKEYSVALALCSWIPMGDPVFIVTPGGYLGEPRKMNGFDLPLSMTAFVSMTHHELLHSLVQNFIDAIVKNDPNASSPLLVKYGSLPNKEQDNVLVHLHLMAIQKAAYQKLNNKELLAATNTLYAFIGGDYQRAWEIISIEGTEPFLKELQEFNAKSK